MAGRVPGDVHERVQLGLGAVLRGLVLGDLEQRVAPVGDAARRIVQAEHDSFHVCGLWPSSGNSGIPPLLG